MATTDRAAVDLIRGDVVEISSGDWRIVKQVRDHERGIPGPAVKIYWEDRDQPSIVDVGKEFRTTRPTPETTPHPPGEVEAKCASCFLPPAVQVTFSSPDPSIDGTTELACNVHRAMYHPGTFFRGFPARADYQATSEFTVVSVEELVLAPNPAKVAEISTEIRGFLNDACDRAHRATETHPIGEVPAGSVVQMPSGEVFALGPRKPSAFDACIGELTVHDVETGAASHFYALPENTPVRVLSRPTERSDTHLSAI